jgi:hypothetical protein
LYNKNVEKKNQAILQKYRIRNDREFLNLSLDKIIKIIDSTVQKNT